MTTTNKPPFARLTLIVEFDDTSTSEEEVARIVDEGRAYGTIKLATYETLQLVKKELK